MKEVPNTKLFEIPKNVRVPEGTIYVKTLTPCPLNLILVAFTGTVPWMSTFASTFVEQINK